MFSRNRALRAVRRLYGDTSGSFTLEASLVFPVILVCTFLLIFFAIYIGQQAIVYYSVSIAGERAAYSWNNSAKEPKTGAYPEGRYDGLYWRLTDDSLLAGLFGMNADAGGEVAFGTSDGGGQEGDSLTKRKLTAASEPLADSLKGAMSYANQALERRIWTEAGADAVPEPLLELRPGTELSARTSAVVVEPAELIRSFDLARYYAAKMKNAKEGEASFASKARAVLNQRAPAK